MFILSNFIFSAFVFKISLLTCKSTAFGENEFEEKEASLQWLQRGVNFNKDHVGIIFSLHGQENLTRKEMSILRQNIIKNFNKVVLLFHDDSNIGVNVFYSELKFWKDVKQDVDISVVILPTVDVKKLNRTRPRPNDKLDLPEYFHLEYESNIITMATQINYLKVIDLHYKLEYAFNMANCSSLLAVAVSVPSFANVVGGILRDMKARAIVFYFEEPEETTKLGAQMMFERRVVLIKECQKLVPYWELNNVKVSFMLLHYGTSPQFYDNKWEMVNFIEYWEKLSDWASAASTTVILNNAVDSSRYFKKRDQSIVEMGWWRLQTRNESSVWMNKIDDALNRFPELSSATKLRSEMTFPHPPPETVLPQTDYPSRPTTSTPPPLETQHGQTESPPLKTESPHSRTNSTILNANIYFVLIIMLALIVVFAMTLIAVHLMRRRAPKVLLTNQEISDFFYGIDSVSTESGTTHAAYKEPYQKTRFEIGMDIVTFEEDAPLLATGEFGKVCQGQIMMQHDETMQVAIKVLDPKKICKVAVKGLLSEIKFLSYIGSHEHIIHFVGANTVDIKFGKVLVFLELCEFGSLKNHLRQIKMSLDNDGASIITVEEQMSDMDDERMSRYLQMMSMNKTPLDPSISEDLLRWSHEICMGMAYLASKNVVHADLTAKNVLLNGEKEVKICDFGLSRRMDNYTSSKKKQQQEPFNWKWMAPETLKFGEFSEKSDVWAYGVTLWEIFSLGKQPYPGLAWNGGFADLLEIGYQLGEPQYNDLNMYSVMRECWIIETQNRPSFAELLTTFTFAE